MSFKHYGRIRQDKTADIDSALTDASEFLADNLKKAGYTAERVCEIIAENVPTSEDWVRTDEMRELEKAAEEAVYEAVSENDWRIATLIGAIGFSALGHFNEGQIPARFLIDAEFYNGSAGPSREQIVKHNRSRVYSDGGKTVNLEKAFEIQIAQYLANWYEQQVIAAAPEHM